MVTPLLQPAAPTTNAVHENERFCFRDFMLMDDWGNMHSLVGWLEDTEDGDPSLQVRRRNGTAQLGITLGNYRCANLIDELALLTREYYKIMRAVCRLPYKEPPLDTSISSWIDQCLESMRAGKDLVLERVS